MALLPILLLLFLLLLIPVKRVYIARLAEGSLKQATLSGIFETILLAPTIRISESF
jgi:type IV secretory pathway VirB6-like protein